MTNSSRMEILENIVSSIGVKIQDATMTLCCKVGELEER